ncbi:hypothetical protein HK100_010834 [Physocladia obscura]|uniref:Uncharacterized protein n=1 Tax=Physocladia obscura TaxID=109957 RepID=A0AAD5T265_9FUNG|nr:hypothetical protein HK100_010834 [Physocladia obscura]
MHTTQTKKTRFVPFTKQIHTPAQQLVNQNQNNNGKNEIQAPITILQTRTTRIHIRNPLLTKLFHPNKQTQESAPKLLSPTQLSKIPTLRTTMAMQRTAAAASAAAPPSMSNDGRYIDVFSFLRSLASTSERLSMGIAPTNRMIRGYSRSAKTLVGAFMERLDEDESGVAVSGEYDGKNRRLTADGTLDWVDRFLDEKNRGDELQRTLENVRGAIVDFKMQSGNNGGVTPGDGVVDAVMGLLGLFSRVLVNKSSATNLITFGHVLYDVLFGSELPTSVVVQTFSMAGLTVASSTTTFGESDSDMIVPSLPKKSEMANTPGRVTPFKSHDRIRATSAASSAPSSAAAAPNATQMSGSPFKPKPHDQSSSSASSSSSSTAVPKKTHAGSPPPDTRVPAEMLAEIMRVLAKHLLPDVNIFPSKLMMTPSDASQKLSPDMESSNVDDTLSTSGNTFQDVFARVRRESHMRCSSMPAAATAEAAALGVNSTEWNNNDDEKICGVNMEVAQIHLKQLMHAIRDETDSQAADLRAQCLEVLEAFNCLALYSYRLGEITMPGGIVGVDDAVSEKISNAIALFAEFLHSFTQTPIDPLLTILRNLHATLVEILGMPASPVSSAMEQLLSALFNSLSVTNENIDPNVDSQLQDAVANFRRIVVHGLKDVQLNIVDESEERVGTLGEETSKANEIIGQIWDAVEKDQTMVEAKNLAAKWWSCLFLNENGAFVFKKSLWFDFVKHVVPGIMGDFSTMTIPLIEYSDGKYEISVQDVVISMNLIMPSLYKIELGNSVMFGLDSDVDVEYGHSIKLKFYQINLDLRELPVSIKKLTFPKIADSGFADVVLPEHGITISIELTINKRDSTCNVFSCDNVQVDITDMALKIHGTKNDSLYGMLNILLLKKIKTEVQKNMEREIRNVIEKWDHDLGKAKKVFTGRKRFGAGVEKPEV